LRIHDEIHTLLDGVPDLEALNFQFEDFSRDFLFSLNSIKDPLEREKAREQFHLQEIHIRRVITEFCERVEEFSMPQSALPSSIPTKPLEDLRSMIPQDLVRIHSNFHQALESTFSPLVQGVLGQGLPYLTKGDLGYSEEAVRAAQNFLETAIIDGQILQDKLTNVNRTLDLPPPSLEKGVRDRMTKVFSRGGRGRGGSEAIAYYQIADELSADIIQELGNESSDTLRSRLLELIRLNTFGIKSGLANQLVNLFRFEDDNGQKKRPFEFLPAPSRLELYFNLLNMGMGFMENLRTQDELLGKPRR
jgi:hypothetical protein